MISGTIYLSIVYLHYFVVTSQNLTIRFQHYLTIFDMGEGDVMPPNAFDYCADTVRSRTLKLSEF